MLLLRPSVLLAAPLLARRLLLLLHNKGCWRYGLGTAYGGGGAAAWCLAGGGQRRRVAASQPQRPGGGSSSMGSQGSRERPRGGRNHDEVMRRCYRRGGQIDCGRNRAQARRRRLILESLS